MADVRLVEWDGARPPLREDVVRRLRDEGYETFPWSDTPGTVYALHDHAHDECLWMLMGEMEFGIAGQSYRLSPGCRLVLPRHTVHSARVIGSGAAQYVIGQRP